MPVRRSSPWLSVPLLGHWFRWLDGDAPQGVPDPLPVCGEDGATERPGLYLAGDLTGVPLLKLAADGGGAFVQRLLADPAFASERKAGSEEVYDLAIVGAGIAGLSAALAAHDAGLRYVVLEASKPLATIHDFPAGKPIHTYPEAMQARSRLRLEGHTKEELLATLEGQLAGEELNIRRGQPLLGLSGSSGDLRLETSDGELRALRVLLATGRGGEPRELGVPGEDQPKVLYRLIDPAALSGQRVLVVGGGDSAAEAALMLADTPDTEVTLSYRRDGLTRPKPSNVAQVREAIAAGRVRALMPSEVTRIDPHEVTLQVAGQPEPVGLANDTVLVMAGRKLPLELLRRVGLRLQGAYSPERVLMLAALLLLSGVVYFGKKSAPVAGGSFLLSLAKGPVAYWGRSWSKVIIGSLAWLSTIGFAVTGLATLALTLRRLPALLQDRWRATKAAYFTAAALLLVGAHLSQHYFGRPLLGRDLGFWYTVLYSVTVLVFGLRRILVRRSRYITAQTSVLIGIQVLFLFLLPEILLPWLGGRGLLGGWAMTNLFPGGSYWRAYGFVLAWPLFFVNLASGQPTVAWLVLSLVQTFVLIPLVVWRWGKGAYCGWVCSCGGLAETLGDEYREQAPHGPRARDAENVGQLVLLAIVAITGWNLATGGAGAALSAVRDGYTLVVDTVMAGVLGVGVYFFLSGRVWCRFFCPLAAWMHVVARLSVYRIFADGDRCISCGLCTRVCHMGIDVMGYASRSRPMDNVECVRCSACVYTCPVQCLNFGRVQGGRPSPTLFGLRDERPEHLVGGPERG